MAIIGGTNKFDGILKDVEFIGLNQTHAWNYSCNVTTDFTSKICRHQGTLLNSGILLCGGYKNKRSCSVLQQKHNKWTDVEDMNEGRHDFAMTYSDGVVIAVGGSGPLSSSELYENSRWTKIANAPVTVESSCLVALGSHEVILIGGRQNGHVSMNLTVTTRNNGRSINRQFKEIINRIISFKNLFCQY